MLTTSITITKMQTHTHKKGRYLANDSCFSSNKRKKVKGEQTSTLQPERRFTALAFSASGPPVIPTML